MRPFNIIWISWKKSPSEIIYDTAEVAKNIVTLSSSGFDIKTKGNKSLTGNLQSHALVVSSLFTSYKRTYLLILIASTRNDF